MKCDKCGLRMTHSKACSSEHRAARSTYFRAYYAKNRAAFIARQVKWDAAHPEKVQRCRKAYQRRLSQSPERLARKADVLWRSKVRKRFGGRLPEGVVLEMLEALRAFRQLAYRGAESGAEKEVKG